MAPSLLDADRSLCIHRRGTASESEHHAPPYPSPTHECPTHEPGGRVNRSDAVHPSPSSGGRVAESAAGAADGHEARGDMGDCAHRDRGSQTRCCSYSGACDPAVSPTASLLPPGRGDGLASAADLVGGRGAGGPPRPGSADPRRARHRYPANAMKPPTTAPYAMWAAAL